jgi:hypothetical protein
MMEEQEVAGKGFAFILLGMAFAVVGAMLGSVSIEPMPLLTQIFSSALFAVPGILISLVGWMI